MRTLLDWSEKTSAGRYEEAVLGDWDAGDGVRFTLERYPTCYRRGVWRLLIEVAVGPGMVLWGCVDGQDQPLRWYHKRENALSEAEAIASVLLRDRKSRGGHACPLGARKTS